MILPRHFWVRLNRLLTAGVGLFRSTMHKWGLVPSANFRYGTEEQTADHIIVTCPTVQMGHLVWRLSMMTLWTGSKEPH